MGSKKGQLFLIAVVFLVGMIFVVQQALFQYSSIQMSEPFERMDVEIFKNMLDVINTTIKETYVCNETKDNFNDKMIILKNTLLEEYGRAYTLEIVYVLDCENWNNVPPNPAPLYMTISVEGVGRDTRGSFDFYHK